MPRVFVPPLLRDLTGGQSEVTAPGQTVRQTLEALEARYPGFRQRLCNGSELKPNLTVVVDAAVEPLGLRAKVTDQSEIHFLPAVGGG